MSKPVTPYRQKKDTTVCITDATAASATAVSEFPLKCVSGVSPLIIDTLFTKVEKPISKKFITA